MSVLRPEKFQKITIVERKDYAPDLWSIRARPEQPLIFKPGQYATLGFEQDGRVLERAYSIVSSPFEDTLEFFFELVTKGELTPWLYHAKPGDTLWMRRQAKGLFTLDPQNLHRNYYLVSTVTGVAPFVSMVRTLAREYNDGKQPQSKVVLLQAASRSWELGYRSELEGLAARHSWLTYIPAVSRPWEDLSWRGEVGRIEDVLRKYLDSFGFEPTDSRVYLCGHPNMIENSKDILRRRGFTKDHTKEEIYWIPKKDSPRASDSPQAPPPTVNRALVGSKVI